MLATLGRLMRRPPARRAHRRDGVLGGRAQPSCWPSSSPAARAGGRRAGGLADPSHSVSPVPDYPDACAPVGADTSDICLRITLDAIDAARAKEGVRPMALPVRLRTADRSRAALRRVDRERVDRGLAPFTGLTTALDADARRGADAARLPPRPGPAYGSVTTEWIGDVDNGLDADFQWLYDDGPNSGVPGCSGHQTSGCWADRQIVLNRFGARHLVMGAAFDPTSATSSGGPRRILTGGHAGHLAQGRALRLHLEAGSGGHVCRGAPAAAGDSLLGIRHGVPGPESQRGAGARLHTRVRRRRDRQLRRPVSARRWAPSTMPTHWRGSGPWCSRRASPD